MRMAARVRRQQASSGGGPCCATAPAYAATNATVRLCGLGF
jgi:hypothetical protein